MDNGSPGVQFWWFNVRSNKSPSGHINCSGGHVGLDLGEGLLLKCGLTLM
jgi:hypothetical protein